MRRVILLLALLGLLAGCGGGDALTVAGQWARNSPMAVDSGAVYMNLTSADGDRLLSASVDPSVASTVEVHETTPVDGETDEAGTAMMTMRPVDFIDLPAGEEVPLEPGGYHIMLIGLAEPLVVGEKFDITLRFENYGEKSVEVEVMEDAPK
ncbi:MAG: copper chaperone PCu(A)C [Acidimicrobiia bacterium]